MDAERNAGTHTYTPTPPEIFNVRIKCKIVKFHFMAAACSTRTEHGTNTPQNMLKIETDY